MGGRGRPPLPALPIVSAGIANLPTAARRRRGEGAPPYRNRIRHFKRILIRNDSPFAPARFLDYARNDEAKYRYAWFAGGRGRPPLPIVSTGIADLPTAARRRADEGAPPYRNRIRHSKRILIRNDSPFAPARFLDYARNDEAKCRDAWFVGGRERPPLPRSTDSKYGYHRLAHGGSPAGGLGRPPLPVLPMVNAGVADLPTGAPCRADEVRHTYKVEVALSL